MEIPVFCYHNAVAESLEKDLAFLAANGYQTLVASEVVDILRGAVEPPGKPVALTFDDGLLSVRTTGLPLLERYDARATVFVITGSAPEGERAPADHDPQSRGDGGGDGNPDGLLGWGDLCALRDSGRMEVGSHGHRHNPVYVPGFDGAPVRVDDYDRLYDVPVPYSPIFDAATVAAVDGTPGRPSRPLFAADTIALDGDEVSSRQPILDDLSASRDLLAQRLGLERLHLCLPYGAGIDDMPELAREAGFESIFWSRRPDREANSPGDDPYLIVRRKHDFVRRLPGTGRRTLLGLFVAKARRRLLSNPWE